MVVKSPLEFLSWDSGPGTPYLFVSFLPLNTEEIRFASGKQKNMKVNVNLGRSICRCLPWRFEANGAFHGFVEIVVNQGPAVAFWLVLALWIFTKCQVRIVPQPSWISHQF